MKKFDVLVVGELNIDLIMNGLAALPEKGKEILAQDMSLAMGSSSAIFACNLSRLGASVAIIGKLGKDSFGDFIINQLKECNVDTQLVQQDVLLKTGVTVVLNYGEERANITHQGAMRTFNAEDVNFDRLPAAKHLHFSSYFLQPAMQQYVGSLFQIARAVGMTTSFDVQWDPDERWQIDLEQVLPHVDVFLPNEMELLQLTGKSTLAEAIDAVKDLVNILVVKRGAKGSLLAHRGTTKELPAFLNQSVVDAVGAGDSFNAGFIHKFIQNEPLEVCQEFGNLTGYISTTAAGGTAAFKDINTRIQHAMGQHGIFSR